VEVLERHQEAVDQAFLQLLLPAEHVRVRERAGLVPLDRIVGQLETPRPIPGFEQRVDPPDLLDVLGD
jgi:hypothetical protein